MTVMNGKKVNRQAGGWGVGGKKREGREGDCGKPSKDG